MHATSITQNINLHVLLILKLNFLVLITYINIIKPAFPKSKKSTAIININLQPRYKTKLIQKINHIPNYIFK